MESQASPADPESPTEVARLRFGIKPKLLLLLFVLNLVAAAAFATFVYRTQKAEILSGVDHRLRTAAAAAAEIVPPAYHASIQGPQSIDPGRYTTLAHSLSRLADAGGFTYVYTYMPFDGRLRTTATSATPDEWREGKVTPFFTLYDTAPGPMLQSLRDGRIRFDEYADSFGRFRSIFVPMKDGAGRSYIVGADMELSHLKDALARSLRTAVLIAVGIFAISMIVGSLLIERIVRPLAQLTGYTRRLAASRFQATPADAAALQAISGRRRDEVGSLAEAMAAMNERLLRYLGDLERATAERVRVESELSAATEIQMGMLPRIAPPVAGRDDLDIHALLRPAKAVGGDLYDFFLLEDGRLFLVVGDVSGKGVPAALFMARTITLFRALAVGGAPVGDVVARVNAELCRENAADMFVTAFAAVLDLETGVLDYSDAGHEAPFVLSAGGALTRLTKPGGMALGVMEDAPYATGSARLAPGDLLLAVTDGVTEAADPAEALFGVDRLSRMLQASAPATARTAALDLLAAVDGFAGSAPQADDIAILAVRRPAPVTSGSRAGTAPAPDGRSPTISPGPAAA